MASSDKFRRIFRDKIDRKGLIFGVLSFVAFVITFPLKTKRRAARKAILNLPSRAERFTAIHDQKIWRSKESISGSGSELHRTVNLRKELPSLINKYKIKSIVDAPCGDFNWMQDVIEKVDVQYVGLDIVNSLAEKNNEKFGNHSISFGVADICDDTLPDCDLLIVRDCIIHLSYSDIDAFFKNIQKVKFKYLLISSYTGSSSLENVDINTSETRVLNLFNPPFNVKRDDVLETITDIRSKTGRENSEILLRKANVPKGILETIL